MEGLVVEAKKPSTFRSRRLVRHARIRQKVQWLSVFEICEEFIGEWYTRAAAFGCFQIQ